MVKPGGEPEIALRHPNIALTLPVFIACKPTVCATQFEIFWCKSERIRANEKSIPRSGNFAIVISAAVAILAAAISLQAQSSLPRRVAPAPTADARYASGPSAKSRRRRPTRTRPLLDVKTCPSRSAKHLHHLLPIRPHAFRLFQQKAIRPRRQKRLRRSRPIDSG